MTSKYKNEICMQSVLAHNRIINIRTEIHMHSWVAWLRFAEVKSKWILKKQFDNKKI